MSNKALVPYQPSGFNIFDLLPAFPWEGPPLPRFLQIFWASLFENLRAPQLPTLPFTSDIETSYLNEEIWEWTDYRGRDRKITVTRNAKVR